MYKAKRILESIGAEELDHYLQNGWFRMKQHVFTTEFLQMGVDFFDAIWLRHELQRFHFPKWFTKMKRHQRFRAQITDFHPGPEHEMLYQSYRESKPEGFPESLESILYGESDSNLFNTRQVNIYDGDTLVGAGFFDLGYQSAMGIVSYYDPSYKPQSMGKLATMYAYDYCHQQGIKYFYPGYFAPNNPSFDYKLHFDPASLEYLDMVRQEWLPISDFSPQDLPLIILQRTLLTLAVELDRSGLMTTLVHNIYFAFTETSKYDAPAVLMICPTEEHDRQYIISYDHHTDEFHMYDCTEARCAEELRMYNGRMICMQHFPFQKPDVSLKRRDDIAANINGWLRMQE